MDNVAKAARPTAAESLAEARQRLAKLESDNGVIRVTLNRLCHELGLPEPDYDRPDSVHTELEMADHGYRRR